MIFAVFNLLVTACIAVNVCINCSFVDLLMLKANKKQTSYIQS